MLQEYDRPNSAYMLFYERVGADPADATNEPPSVVDATAADAAAASPAQAQPVAESRAATEPSDMMVSPAAARPAQATATAAAEPMAVSGNGDGAAAVAAKTVAEIAAAETAAEMAAPAAAAGIPEHGDGGGGSGSGLPYGMPLSVYEEVMRANLHCLQEQHTLTKPYFRCVNIGGGKGCSPECRCPLAALPVCASVSLDLGLKV